MAVQRQLATSSPGSTLLVIDLRRYESWLLDAARARRSAPATPWSPCRTARCRRWRWRHRCSFTLLAESVSPFESQLGTLALLELLVACVAERLQDSAEQRLASVEAAWAEARSLTDG